MHRLASAFVSVALICLTMAASVAGPLEEGRALYKAGNYTGAVAKLEAATRQDPQDAKAWWQLNFAYNKLGRYPDALAAARQAGKLDGTYSFASDPSKYSETLQRLERKAGGSARQPSTVEGSPTSQGSGYDEMLRALMQGDVYIAPGASADAARLGAVSRELRPTVVKFVVVNSKANSSTLVRNGDRIRKYLSLGRGYVILASRSGVAVATTQVSRSTASELALKVAPQMQLGDTTGGLEQLARSLVQSHNSTSQGHVTGIVFLLVGIAAVIILVVALRRSADRKRMSALRGPLEVLKTDVISALNRLDDNLAALPAMRAETVRQARLDAGNCLDQAAKLMATATNSMQLGRAKTLLDQAMREIARGQAAVRADAAAPAAPAAPSPTSTAATSWTAVPEGERGVCFFCSRPSFLDELTPVTVNLGEGPQKVLACAADLSTIKSGAVPQVRAFERDGRYVPWYADRGYNPYDDYYRRGYDNRSLLTDLVTISVIDHMFWDWHRPSWGYGYGTPGYAFYPDHHVYTDYYSERAASSGDFSDGGSGGGADFLGGGSGSSDGAGADFLGSDNS